MSEVQPYAGESDRPAAFGIRVAEPGDVWLATDSGLYVEGDGHSGAPVWQIVRQADSLGAGQSTSFSDAIAAGLTAGPYRVEAELRLSTGALLSRAGDEFVVHANALQIELESSGIGQPIPLGRISPFTVRLRNTQPDPLSGLRAELRFVEGGLPATILWQQPLQELPGAGVFEQVVDWEAASTGRHELALEVFEQAGGLSLGTARLGVEVVECSVVLTLVGAGEIVESETASVRSWVQSTCSAEVSITTNLRVGNSVASGPAVVLGPLAGLEVDVPIPPLPPTGEAAFEVAGEVVASISVPVVRRGPVDVLVSVSGPFQVGAVAPGVRLTNRGAPVEADLTWWLDGALVGAHSEPLGRGETTLVVIPISTSPGTHQFAWTSSTGESGSSPLEVFASDTVVLTWGGLGTVEEGPAMVEFEVQNPTPMAEEVEASVEVFRGGVAQARVAKLLTLAPGFLLVDAFPIVLHPGINEVVLRVGVEERRELLDILPARRGQVTMTQASRGPGIVGLRAEVVNQGPEAWSGELTGEDLLLGARFRLPRLAPGEARLLEWTLPVDEIPAGRRTARLRLNAQGEELGSSEFEILVSPAVVALEGVTPPPTASAGATAVIEFNVRNTGDVPSPIELAVDAGAFGATVIRTAIPPTGGQSVFHHLDIPWDAVSENHAFTYLLRSADGEVLESGSQVFPVAGVTAEVHATLDRTYYRPGDPVIVTVALGPVSEVLASGSEMRVSYAGDAQEIAVDLGPGSAQVQTTFTAVERGGKLAFGLYSADGRGVVLDAIHVPVIASATIVTTDRTVYSWGDTIQVTVVPETAGEIELHFLDQTVTQTIEGTSQFSFQVPTGHPSGTLEVSYLFNVNGELVDDGVVYLDIDGVRVRILELTLDRDHFEDGELVRGSITVEASRALSAVLQAWLVGASEEEFELPSQALTLEPGVRKVIPLAFTLASPESGLFSLRLAVADAGGGWYAATKSTLTHRLPALIRADVDPTHPPGPAHGVALRWTALGAGPATLSVELNGETVHTETVVLGGFTTGRVQLNDLAPGFKDGRVVLEAGHGTSRPVAFEFGRVEYAPLPGPDLSIDPRDFTVAVRSGGTLRLDIAVRNQGDISAGASVVKAWASDSSDQVIVIGEFPLSEIAPGQAAAFSTEWLPPQGATALMVSAMADFNQDVEERDEANNLASRLELLDSVLSGVEVQPSVLAPGGQATIDYWFRSRAAAPISGVQGTLDILSPGSGQAQSWTTDIETLSPGQLVSLQNLFAAESRMPGRYTAILTVRAGEQFLSQVMAPFEIESQPAFVGSIDADWLGGTTISTTYEVSVTGNVGFTFAQAVVEIWSEDGAFHGRFPLEIWASPGQTVGGDRTIDIALEPGNYSARLLVLDSTVASSSFEVLDLANVIFGDEFETGALDRWSGGSSFSEEFATD